MAQWSNFYETDGFEPEIVVGMYDRWLSQLDFGPTQAERMLVHTPMMEIAHERRFVAGETKSSMSDFEVEHPVRIEQTIQHLESHFSKYRADDTEDSVMHQPGELIGLAPLPVESIFHQSFPGANQLLDTAMPPIEQVLKGLCSGRVVQQDPSVTELKFDMQLTVDDSKDTSDGIHQKCIEKIRTVSMQSRELPGKRPRQRKAVRLRRIVALSHEDDSDECNPKPMAKRAKA